MLDMLPGMGLPDRQLFPGHKGTIRCVAFSPDGRMAATASGDHTSMVWDLQTGKLAAMLGSQPSNLTGGGAGKGHLHIVSGVCFSPDGKYVCTTSNDKSLRLWRASNGEPLAILQGHMQFVNCCKWAPNGSAVLTGSSDKTVRAWRLLRDGNPDMSQFSWGNGTVLEFAFAHCNASMQDDHQDSEEYRRMTAKHRTHLPEMKCVLTTLVGHEGGVTAVDVSPCCGFVLSVSSDKTARLWDFDKALDQKLLSSEAPGGGSRALIRTLRGHQRAVISCCFSPDSRHCATGSQDFTVRVYDVHTGGLVRDILAGECYCTGVAFSGAASDLLLVSTGGKKVRVFSVLDASVSASLPSAGRSVSSIAVLCHARGQSLCIAGGDHVMCYVPDVLSLAEKAAAAKSSFSLKRSWSAKSPNGYVTLGTPASPQPHPSKAVSSHSLPERFLPSPTASTASPPASSRLRLPSDISAAHSASPSTTKESLSLPLLPEDSCARGYHVRAANPSSLPPLSDVFPAAPPPPYDAPSDPEPHSVYGLEMSSSILHTLPTSPDGIVTNTTTTSMLSVASPVAAHRDSPCPASPLGPSKAITGLKWGVDPTDPSLIESPPTALPGARRVMLQYGASGGRGEVTSMAAVV